MPELRCPHKMHGDLDGDACTVTMKCSNSRCGARSGVVVLHKFDLFTGKLIETKVFKDPIKATQGGETNGTARVRTPVRHP
jgi:hypothetical protein